MVRRVRSYLSNMPVSEEDKLAELSNQCEAPCKFCLVLNKTFTIVGSILPLTLLLFYVMDV